jgi:hypothetical protein
MASPGGSDGTPSPAVSSPPGPPSQLQRSNRPAPSPYGGGAPACAALRRAVVHQHRRSVGSSARGPREGWLA